MTIPTTMRAITVPQPGGPEVLTLAEMPVPVPAPGEILIRVASAGLNGADISQRQGAYPPPPGASPLLGLEVSGTVVAVGDGVTWQPGDRVVALLAGGGYAEYAVAHAGHVVALPDGLDPVEAGGVIETVVTVWCNMLRDAGLQPGEAVLIHGGSSGIGTTAIQLAKAIGARVFTTAGSEEKLAACRALGADRAINYREESFADVIKAETGGAGVDVILDIVGASYLEPNLRSLALNGRLSIIAMAGGRVGQLDIGRLMMRRLIVRGTTLRSRPAAEKAELVAAAWRQALPLITSGALVPVIDSVFPLADVAEAHRHMESSRHIGKILLRMDS